MTPTDKLTEMTYHDYKDRFAAALERLCEEYPEADLDDLKREAEQLTIKAEVPNNNEQDSKD